MLQKMPHDHNTILQCCKNGLLWIVCTPPVLLRLPRHLKERSPALQIANARCLTSSRDLGCDGETGLHTLQALNCAAAHCYISERCLASDVSMHYLHCMHPQQYTILLSYHRPLFEPNIRCTALFCGTTWCHGRRCHYVQFSWQSTIFLQKFSKLYPCLNLEAQLCQSHTAQSDFMHSQLAPGYLQTCFSI